MKSRFLRSVHCLCVLALAVVGTPALAAPEGAAPGPIKSGGYALDASTCGIAPMAFPKLRLGMRSGYCAGLVAGKDDGLIFPRSIVQVPNRDVFVVADMGGWGPNEGRLLLLDPQAPAGKRISVLMGKLDLVHGLAV